MDPLLRMLNSVVMICSFYPTGSCDSFHKPYIELIERLFRNREGDSSVLKPDQTN